MSFTIYAGLSQRLQTRQLDTRIIEISTETSPARAIKSDLEDDQKRWLIVGICLHSVISPALRTFIQPDLSILYNTLQQSDNIHQQTYPNQLKRYRPTNKELNYEAINNNATVPKVRGKKDEPNYDYKVTNTVGLSKLFLQTHMTQYTGFDDTCDSSALLGIIINLDVFPPLVKLAAEQVRKDIRNAWAHCNFTEWDIHKYQSSFQEMYQFIRSLALSPQDEVEILGKLTHWETNGIHLLQGTTVGLELLQELKTETGDIARYLRAVVTHTDDCLKDVRSAISDVENSLDKLIKDILTLSCTCDQLTSDMKTVQKDVEILNKKADDLNLRQKEHERDFDNIKQGVQNIEIKVSEACLKVELEKTRNDLKDTIDKNKAEIDAISKYVLHSRPDDKIFFYPPNRNRSFIGREDEIDELMQKFTTKSSEHALQVICGLGGTGKTSLAIEFAWRFQNYYPGGVFWMSAESNDVLEDSFQRLSIDIDTVGRNAKETMYKTLKWLSSMQNRWLLVADNVDMEDIRGSIRELLIGSWKRQSVGHILITSRRETSLAEEEFDVCASDCLTLKTFSNHESKIFMQARIGNQSETNNESLDELIQELGGLPLALEQAAAHIKTLKCSFKEYLEKFQETRLKLLREIKPSYEISKERQTVRTTWKLNFDYIERQSELLEIGSAATIVMNVMAFLFADGIPLELINVGSPEVCVEDLRNTLKHDLGSKQILEILTRFSLFHWSDRNAVSVHRLVQEVIRDSIKSSDELQNILLCATRMLNYALEHQPSPNDAMKVENFGRTSLKTWHRLSYHATSLKTYLFNFKFKADQKAIYFNLETAKLLQATSIYHSLVQRQDQALKDQDQMLTILAAIGVSNEDFRNLTAIKIPLMKQERLVIQGSMNNLICSDQTIAESENQNHFSDTAVKSLKKRGNDAFKSNQYLAAVQYYTEAVVRSEVVDPILFSNRSLSFLRSGDYENALRDADRCIEADPYFWKGYCWKSYAIAKLIKLGHLSPSWESSGLAAAAVAGHLNGQCLLEYRMKIYYPIIGFKVIENYNLGKELASLSSHRYTTLLLRNGRYFINRKEGPIITKSIQIIGIEECVEIICSDDVIPLVRPNSLACSVKYTPEPQINVYFENVIFPKGTGRIFVGKDVNATFYRCKFSNGRRGCEGIPYCKGGKGCVNNDPNICKIRTDESETKNDFVGGGISGCPGIVVGDESMAGAKAFIQNCIFDRCGSGGIFCEGEGSVIAVKDSIFKNMIQMGAVARYGGTIIAENCSFVDNQTHGVAIGPMGNGQFTNCIIQGNKQEGFWCGRVFCLNDPVNVNNKEVKQGGSTCSIRDSIICQNGKCGIKLEGGSYEITENKIFENWMWGIMTQKRSSTRIINNDIFENKCGGVRIGINFSASVLCDGNTIRDHSGPGMHAEKVPENIYGRVLQRDMPSFDSLPVGEITIYSHTPMVTNRNVFKNNNKGFQHPQQLVEVEQTCCCCRKQWNNLKRCAKCKKATYCSKDCQSVHWKRHKHICKMLREKFNIIIDMSKTMTNDDLEPGSVTIDISLTPMSHSDIPPNTSSSQMFIVKIQSGFEYTLHDPNKLMNLYDQTRTVNFYFRNPQVYNIIGECGILCATQLTTKKIYCWASFKGAGKLLCLHTENLAPGQIW